VIIRRNRLDLINNTSYQNEIKNLSIVKDPQEWFYELSKEQSDFYEKIISVFSDTIGERRFTGAIYKPAHYENLMIKITIKTNKKILNLLLKQIFTILFVDY